VAPSRLVPTLKGPSKSSELSALRVGLALSTSATVFFAADVASDFFYDGDFPGGNLHLAFELVVVSISTFAFAFHIRGLLRFSRKHQRVSDQMRVATGEFASVVEELFSAWQLSPAERDVAIFLVKGMAFKEIAAARQSKEGTVKAQANAIYRKADISGRHELMSLFLDELLQNIELNAHPRQS
jgi:DNA-binding CsgD family transcriptional regulator